MQLEFDGTFFKIAASPEVNAKARAAKFSFDPTAKVFYTPVAQVAARLREFAGESAKREITRRIIVKTPWPGRIPSPPDKTPLAFQLPAARFALERNRSYLALDAGLGKTIIAALIINSLDGTPVVVIAPPSLALNAKIKLLDWATARGIQVAIYDKRIDYGNTAPDVLIVPDSIIHAEAVKRIIARMVCMDLATLIVDEAHRFKTGSTRRTRALLGVGGRGGIVSLFARVVLMSGTPMPNRPLELFPMVQRLAPEVINGMNKFDYAMKYCGAYLDEETGHWNFNGASNVDELFSNLRRDFMLRIKKKDVLTELPPATEELVFLAENVPAKVAPLEKKLLAEYSPEDLMGHIAPNGHVATYRRLLGVAKVPLAVQYIIETMEDTGEAFIVFAIHKEVVRLLAKGLARFNPLVIDGDVKRDDRQAIADKFQNDKKHLGLIGNIDTMGEGFTLIKARRGFAVESAWTPGKNDQAKDRIHRIGQTGQVLWQHLVFVNSMDRKVIETNIRKMKTINQL